MALTKPHFTFWIAAALGLVWNLMGCMNYIVQTNPVTVAQMPEVYQLIINARPSWATAGFAVGVFGGAVGCILLLLRQRVAVAVFILSLAGIVLTVLSSILLIGFALAEVFSVLVACALLWYASIAQRAGWLR